MSTMRWLLGLDAKLAVTLTMLRSSTNCGAFISHTLILYRLHFNWILNVSIDKSKKMTMNIVTAVTNYSFPESRLGDKMYSLCATSSSSRGAETMNLSPSLLT